MTFGNTLLLGMDERAARHGVEKTGTFFSRIEVSVRKQKRETHVTCVAI